jgi:hypothetical protein
MTTAVGCDSQPSFFSGAPNESPGLPPRCKQCPWVRARRCAHADAEVRDSAARYVDDVGVAFACRARRQARCVRPRPRLGQAITREMLPQSFGRNCCRCAADSKGIDHPRSHSVDRQISGGRRTARGEFLEDEGSVKTREGRTADVVLDADPAEPPCRRLPQCLGREYFVFVPSTRKRLHALARSAPRERLQGALRLRQLEIHRHWRPSRHGSRGGAALMRVRCWQFSSERSLGKGLNLKPSRLTGAGLPEGRKAIEHSGVGRAKCPPSARVKPLCLNARVGTMVLCPRVVLPKECSPLWAEDARLAPR